MTLVPLLNASTVIQAHTAAALAAAVLLVPIALSTKGTARHMLLGRFWVGLMLVTAVTSFWIVRPGGYSAIHALSVITLVSLACGILFCRMGRISAHLGFMIGAASGLLIAGAFTLWPGRIMHQVVFG
jgi:uncharacterized membrane protein